MFCTSRGCRFHLHFTIIFHAYATFSDAERQRYIILLTSLPAHVPRMPPARGAGGRGRTSPTNCLPIHPLPCSTHAARALDFTQGERVRTSNEPRPHMPPACPYTHAAVVRISLRSTSRLHWIHACQWSGALNRPSDLTGSSLGSYWARVRPSYHTSTGPRVDGLRTLSARALQPARNHQLQLSHLCRLSAAITFGHSLQCMPKRLVRKLHANGALLLTGHRS